MMVFMMAVDLCLVQYTSIAEIKGFRSRLDKISRNRWENEISRCRGTNADPQHPPQRSQSSPVTAWRRPTPRLFFKPSARRHSTGILHSVPFTGTRHHLDVWPAFALGTSLTYAASCPDRVLARDLRQITAPITARNFFILPKVQSHRLVARMQCHEGMHLLEQGIWIRPKSYQMLPLNRGKWPNLPCQTEYYRIRFSPRHTRQPLHEAANYLYNHYRYL
jgi:hypothetical protein